MHRLLLSGLLVVGALSGFVQGGTVAYFTSAAGSVGNQFTAGTVSLTNSPSSSAITFTTLVPGDKITVPLTVTNGGTITLVYAVSSSVTNVDGKGLGGQLTLRIRSGVTTCTTAGFDTDGADLYGSALSPQPLGNVDGSTRNLVGNTSTFPSGGRDLSPSNAETLCFQVQLPENSSAGSYQGAETTATFTFVSHQKAGT